MKITIISLGKIKEQYIKDALNEYSKRLSAYTTLEFIEIPAIEIKDENLTKKALYEEGQKVLSYIKKDSFVITLEIQGKQLSSIDFAAKVNEIINSGTSELIFIIGSSCGLSQIVSDRADYKLSLSKMTFIHQMTKVILLEQIYRAFKIMHKETYHK